MESPNPFDSNPHVHGFDIAMLELPPQSYQSPRQPRPSPDTSDASALERNAGLEVHMVDHHSFREPLETVNPPTYQSSDKSACSWWNRITNTFLAHTPAGSRLADMPLSDTPVRETSTTAFPARASYTIMAFMCFLFSITSWMLIRRADTASTDQCQTTSNNNLTSLITILWYILCTIPTGYFAWHTYNEFALGRRWPVGPTDAPWMAPSRNIRLRLLALFWKVGIFWLLLGTVGGWTYIASSAVTLRDLTQHACELQDMEDAIAPLYHNVYIAPFGF